MRDLDVKKLYADIIYVNESLDGILSKNTLYRRKYMRYLNTIKACLEDKNKIKLSENTEILKQLSNCQKCRCFTCDKECITDGCDRCEPGGLVVQCDNNISTTYHFKNKTFTLKSNKLKSINTYKVLAIIQDIKYNEYFILLSCNEKRYVSYYYPEVGGDAFSEIKDIEDFNFAIKVFEESEVNVYE